MSYNQMPAINSLSTYTPEKEINVPGPTDNQINQEKDVPQLFRQTIAPDSLAWIRKKNRTSKKKEPSSLNTRITASKTEGFNNLNSMLIGKPLLQDLLNNTSNLPPETFTNLRFELVKKKPRVFNEDFLTLIKHQKNDSVISKNQGLIDQCIQNIKDLTQTNEKATAPNINDPVLHKIRVSTLQIFLKNCKRDAVDQEALNYFEKEITPLYSNRTDLLQVDVNAKHLNKIMKHRIDKKIAPSTYSKIRKDLDFLLKPNSFNEKPVKETISQTPVETQNPIVSSTHPLTQPGTPKSNKRSIEAVSIEITPPKKRKEINKLDVMRIDNIMNSVELDRMEEDAISALSSLRS